mmetsp:Transcript_28023/g.86829  ORF Transcript_28023/g.86829 Transcript_28023/m.86829 type:complete len:262 (-) Transcript_28023:70-855(-)
MRCGRQRFKEVQVRPKPHDEVKRDVVLPFESSEAFGASELPRIRRHAPHAGRRVPHRVRAARAARVAGEERVRAAERVVAAHVGTTLPREGRQQAVGPGRLSPARLREAVGVATGRVGGRCASAVGPSGGRFENDMAPRRVWLQRLDGVGPKHVTSHVKSAAATRDANAHGGIVRRRDVNRRGRRVDGGVRHRRRVHRRGTPRRQQKRSVRAEDSDGGPYGDQKKNETARAARRRLGGRGGMNHAAARSGRGGHSLVLPRS